MTRQERRFDAPLARVLDVVSDLEAYPLWVRDLTGVDVLQRDELGRARRARLCFSSGPLRDDVTLDYAYETSPSLWAMTWSLVEAQQIRGLRGRYELRPLEAGVTEVRYGLDVDPGLPLHAALKATMQRRIVAVALDELAVRVRTSSGD